MGCCRDKDLATFNLFYVYAREFKYVFTNASRLLNSFTISFGILFNISMEIPIAYASLAKESK